MWNTRCQIVHANSKGTAESVLREELKKYSSRLREEFWRLLPQDTHLVRRTDKFFDKAPISTVKMWKCRVKVAEKMGIEKRNTIGTDLNFHLQLKPNKEEKKSNKMKRTTKINPSVSMKHLVNAGATYKPRDIGPILKKRATKMKRTTKINPSVSMKHLVNAGATYKPKNIGSTLKKRAPRKKNKKCTFPSAYMKHSINVSATYKPKQSIDPTTKNRNTTSNDQKSNQPSKSTCMDEPTNDDNPYKSRKVNRKPKQSQMLEMNQNMNGSKRRQVEVISHTERKIEKKLPPIRIAGKFEVNGKCRKRKIGNYVKIRDSNSENQRIWKKGTDNISTGKRKTISEVKDRLRHKRKLNHDFIVIKKAASPPEKYRS